MRKAAVPPAFIYVFIAVHEANRAVFFIESIMGWKGLGALFKIMEINNM